MSVFNVPLHLSPSSSFTFFPLSFSCALPLFFFSLSLALAHGNAVRPSADWQASHIGAADNHLRTLRCVGGVQPVGMTVSVAGAPPAGRPGACGARERVSPAL